MTGTEYRETRKQLGLKQAALAWQLEIGRRTITRLERLPKIPRHHELAIRHLAALHQVRRLVHA